MRLVWGTVESVVSERAGAQLLTVSAPAVGASGRAVAYTALVGACAPGDTVLLNTTAVDLALGTGGRHFVVARGPEHAGDDGVVLDAPSAGHIMKLRYTPLQTDVRAAEEDPMPEYPAGAAADDLAGMPVVCCGLHSQVPAVAAAVKERLPRARVAYVMTDQAALPIALSETVAACRDAGLVDATVTCGQAFGGDHEAVNLYGGLLAAQKVGRADVAVAGIGPGVVGTGSVFGHGGVAQGEALNAVRVVGGTAVAVPRISFADARERHRGVSHHTLTALTRIAEGATVVVPALPPEQAAVVDEAFGRAGVWERHRRADMPSFGMPDLRGVRLSSMGRAFDEDPAFFLAAFSAGRFAAGLVEDAGL